MGNENSISPGADGFYQPQNDEEVIALINKARRDQLQLRIRGSAHSVAWSIYTDPVHGLPVNKTIIGTPPKGDDINISLNKMNRLDWIDENQGIVEVGAGLHLGADPYEAIGSATLKESFLYQIFEKGWGINDLGGISHQTVSGFISTGSAGGSLTYSLDNVLAFWVIDGTGQAGWVERGSDEFDAVSVSMGLLGVITKIRFKLARTFNIYGQEITVPESGPDSPIDLFGPGDDKRPSLAQFLKDAPYSRILWWPQKGLKRLQIWQAVRKTSPDPQVFHPVPYQEFKNNIFGVLEQLVAGIFFTTIGNPGFFSTIAKFPAMYRQFMELAADVLRRKVGRILAYVLSFILLILVSVVAVIFVLIFSILPFLKKLTFASIVNIFTPLTGKGLPVLFEDYYWRSLPMDNTADDILLGTEFTEIWVPISYTEEAMNLLGQMFREKGYDATGYYTTELYGTCADTAWMSPSYSDGTDEYKDGVIRFDVFWYRGNAGTPNEKGAFFSNYWSVFKDNNIPFRLHWGKFVPGYELKEWAKHYRDNLPKFDAFLELRAKRDPDNIFYTQYWKSRLTGEE